VAVREARPYRAGCSTLGLAGTGRSQFDRHRVLGATPAGCTRFPVASRHPPDSPRRLGPAGVFFLVHDALSARTGLCLARLLQSPSQLEPKLGGVNEARASCGDQRQQNHDRKRQDTDAGGDITFGRVHRTRAPPRWSYPDCGVAESPGALMAVARRFSGQGVAATGHEHATELARVRIAGH
jgi:hypothetical protein